MSVCFLVKWIFVFWFFLMLSDAIWCYLMLSDAFWCYLNPQVAIRIVTIAACLLPVCTCLYLLVPCTFFAFEYTCLFVLVPYIFFVCTYVYVFVPCIFFVCTCLYLTCSLHILHIYLLVWLYTVIHVKSRVFLLSWLHHISLLPAVCTSPQA